MNIAKNITELIGSTPLIHLSKLQSKYSAQATVIGKMECFNPLSSVKDRAALSMIEQAESEGKLKAGSTLVEPTSGNTGIALAYIAASRGYRCILTMPESMSMERRNLLKALGAELVLTPAAQGMLGAVDKAKELLSTVPNSVLLGQFDNPANPAAHTKTAEEIWNDTDGNIDILVAGVGTGGTISGTAKALKQKNSAIKAVAVEPAASAVLSGNAPAPHKIQGIGANFIPKNYDAQQVDEIVTVTNEDAMETARFLAHNEGIFVGISSGAAAWAAAQIATRPENVGKTIVAILPDTGERYLSTGIFEVQV